jgi:hypothetical protein
MKFLSSNHGGTPRPPLPGRLTGLALALLLLSFAVYVALDVATVLMSAVMPLLVLIGIYQVFLRGRK